MIRECDEQDKNVIYDIINDAASAYAGVIPADRYHEPYMPLEELEQELADGVRFWGWTDDQGVLAGVMGLQDKGEVALIRHAYVRTNVRNRGIGGQLLAHLRAMTAKPVLIGTWEAADWAVAFYEKHGFRLVSSGEKERLLRTYWNVPPRQIEVSVVLSGPGDRLAALG